MTISYPFVNCSDIILPETEQVAAQPNSSAHAWRPRLRPQGRSTVFVSWAFCCRLCDRAEIPDRVALSRDERRGPASEVDPWRDHSPPGAPRPGTASRSNAIDGDQPHYAINRHWLYRYDV